MLSKFYEKKLQEKSQNYKIEICNSKKIVFIPSEFDFMSRNFDFTYQNSNKKSENCEKSQICEM